GCGVKGIGRPFQFNAEIVISVKTACLIDQGLGKFRIDPPIASFIGIGQRSARYAAANAYVVKLLALGSEARLDVSQTFPPRKWAKRYASKLVETTKALARFIAIVAPDAAPKCVHRQVIHPLRKDKLALVPLPLPAARIAGGSLEVRWVQLKSVTG